MGPYCHEQKIDFINEINKVIMQQIVFANLNSVIDIVKFIFPPKTDLTNHSCWFCLHFSFRWLDQSQLLVLFTSQFSQIFKMCDVTRSNFEEKCPVILESIRHCSFIAFDAEFTVLKANDACTSRYSISKSFKKSHFLRFLQLCQKRQKNSWKFVYVLAKQCRSSFNLTNFLKE